MNYSASPKYTFSGTPASSLNNLYFASTEDHKITIDLILDKAVGDFNVSIGGFEELAYNMVSKTRPDLLDAAKADNVTFWAAETLKPFVLEQNDKPYYTDSKYEPSNFTEQYKSDRAMFLYYLCHPEEQLPFEEHDIHFKDTLRNKEKLVKNGIMSTSDREFWWGTDEGETFGSYRNSRDDHIYGMDGNDTLSGYYGNDYLEGGEGQDTLSGGLGDDTFGIIGEDDDYDIFQGGDGYDRIIGSDKDDVIRVHDFSGDNTVEEIDGNSGEDIIAGTDESDVMDFSGTTLKGIKEIRGGDKRDIITGSSGNDTIYGEDGNDELRGGSGFDSLRGGLGNDTLIGGQDNDILRGGKGYDTYVINPGDGIDTIYDERESSGEMRGVIKDGDGNVIGGTIWEETGKDTGTYVNRETGAQATMNSPLTMQVGNSQVVIADFENGDFGINLLEYSEDTTSINLTGSDDAEYLYDPGEPVSAGRNIQGGGGRDFVAGEEGSDVLSGGADNDWIVGAGGVDRIDGGSGNDYISWFDGGSSVSGGDGDDILTAVAKESFLATPKPGFTLDAIWGDVASNLELQYGEGFSLTGEGYLAKSWGFLPPGTYTGDSAMGTGWTYSLTVGHGDQFDLKYFHPTEAPGGVNPAWEIGFEAVPQPQAEQGVVLMGDAGNDLLAGHNQSDVLSGGMDRDILLGNEGDDYLYGGGGNDDIAGGAGDDMVFGGDDTDYIYGESGSDTLYGEDGVDYIWGDSQSPELSALDGNDFVEGGRGNDQIVGQGGDDTLMGGDGNDTIVGDNGDDSVAGDDTIYGDAGEDTLFGEGGNDRLYGGDDSDQILAGDGNDILSGGSGDDGLYGGAGDDIMSGDDGNDLLRGYTGIDEIDGGSGDDTLYGEDGDDILRGGTGNDTLEGGAGDDTYVFNLGDGSDVIKNNDMHLTNSLAFGAGIGIEDLSAQKEGLDLIITVGDGGDQITVVDWYRAQGYQILYFNFDGGVVKSVFELLDEVSVKQIGTAENDTMNGSGSADFLVGGGGDDDLYGFRGNDILDGGDGNDDLYGSSENDTLSGGFGSDRLYGGIDDDILAGGPGEDYLTGEAGDDTYVFNIGDGQDIIVNNDNEGMDTVSFGPGIRASDITPANDGDDLILNVGGEGDRIRFLNWARYKINNNRVDRFLFGDDTSKTAAEILAGNTLYQDGDSGRNTIIGFEGADNVIDGKADNDSLIGSEGNDTLIGGDGDDDLAAEGGNDDLYGGSGNDSYYFFHGWGQETIHDYDIADGFDTLALEWDYLGAENISHEDVTLHKDGDDLVLNVKDSDDKVTVKDYFVPETIVDGQIFDHKINAIRFAMGIEWDQATIEANIQSSENQAPVVSTEIPDQIITANELFTYEVPGTSFADPDVGDVLGYSASLADDSELPSWLSFDPETRTFSGTPSSEETIGVKVTASDPDGLCVSDVFELSIEAANQAPVVSNEIPDQNATTDELFSYEVPGTSFADPDAGDVLIYSASLSDGSDLPAWLSFDPETRTFSGTPTTEETISVRVMATDQDGLSISDIFDISVEAANQAPVVSEEIPDLNATTEELFTYVIPETSFSDPDAGDVLSYSATQADGSELPPWLSFDPETRTFNGTPTAEETISVKVTATDLDGLGVSDIFDLSVEVANQAPVVNEEIPDQNVTADELYNYVVPETTFTDPDIGDALNYSASLADGSELPAWLSFDPETRTFSGAPTTEETISVRVMATDQDGLSISDIFDISVEAANQAPIVNDEIPDQSGTSDELFSYAFPETIFTDPDAGDELSYSASLSDGSELPAWLSFDPETRAFNGTPTAEETISVKVTATDQDGLSVSDVFDISVEAANQAPVVSNEIPDQAATADELFSYSIPATSFIDPDTGDVLTYSASLGDGSELPSWLNFDPETLTFGGIPTAEETISVKVTATDQDGLSVSDVFDVSIEAANQSPVVSEEIPDQSGTAQELFSYIIPENTFIDPDTGDVLSYSASLSDGSELPSWLNFDPETRTFSGTPTTEGTISVKVTATDPDGLSVSDVFDVGIETANNAPIVNQEIPDQSATTDEVFTFEVPDTSFADPDTGDVLSYTAALSDGSELPSWLSFDPESRTFNGTPTAEEIISVKVTATDQDGLSVSDVFDLSVEVANQAPVVNEEIPDQNATTDESFVYVVPNTSFVDPDSGDVLSYSASLSDGSDLPSWLSFDPETRTFTGTPSAEEVISVKVTATDPDDLSVSDVFELSIETANQAPVVSEEIPDQSGTVDELFSYIFPETTFTDPEIGDALNYSASLADGSELPSWLNFDPETRTFSGTPPVEENISVKVTATDPDGLSVSDVFNVSVEAVNQAPIVSEEIPDQAATADELFSYIVPETSFTDPDTGDVLSYSASLADGSELPAWLSFDPETRTFSGTPTAEGTISVKVTAKDQDGLGVSDVFDVSIEAANQAPLVSEEIPDQITTADDPFSYVIPGSVFSDPDTGDVLTYNASLGDGSELPSWLSFDPEARTFSGTPTTEETISIRVTATDPDGLSVSDIFDVTVETVNHAPIVNDEIPDQSATTDESFTYMVPDTSFIDPDTGDVLTYSATLSDGSDLPSWLNFDSETRTFSGTPTTEESLTIKVTAIDPDGLSVSDVFDLSVQAEGTVINGTPGSDSLYGTENNDVLNGGTGNDTLYGYAGDDTFIVEGTDQGYDKFSGGEGYDRIVGSSGDDLFGVYYFRRDNTVEEIDGGEGFNIIKGKAVRGSYLDFSGTKLRNIAQIEGNIYNDYITGSNESNLIIGGTGNDVLYGGGGDDTFIVEGLDQGYDKFSGGEGYDRIVGSSGDDSFGLYYFYRDNTVEEIDGGEGFNIIKGKAVRGSYMDFSGTELKNIARIEGNIYNDYITGSDQSNLIIGDTGNDVLYGGGGDDTFIVEGLDQGYDKFSGGEGYDRIVGGSGDDSFGVNYFRRDNTVEEIDGGEGFNIIKGKAVRGSYMDFSGTELKNIARIEGNIYNDYITGSDQSNLIIGDTGNDVLYGGGGDDTFIVEGLDQGYDKFSGGEGYDRIVGGSGDDSFGVNYFRRGNTVEEIDGGEGFNIIKGKSVRGNYMAFSGTELKNIARIEGGEQTDYITGSNETDTIIGGTGNDVINGNNGDDTYIFNIGDGQDIVRDTAVGDGTANAGNDTVQFGEDVSSNGIAFYQSGNDLVIGFGLTDQVTIRDQGLENNAVENFQLGDGSYMTSADINVLIQEMTSFSADQGISVSSVDDVKNNQDLMNLIAGSWHRDV